MEINSIATFVSYYERTRSSTDKILQAIPPDKFDWAYAQGKFSFADMIRHIAGIERHLFMEVIQGRKPNYKGCGKDIADGYENTMAYYREMHQQSMEILNSLTDEDLQKTIKTMDGKETTVGNFLRALIVHEVHHRGALCIYLNLLNIPSPPVLGLKEEDVVKLSKG